MVCQSAATVDPLNQYAQAIKRITGKSAKSKTDDDLIEIGRLEWLAGLYWSDVHGRAIVPGMNIESCIRSGAMVNKNGEKIRAGVFLTEDEILIRHANPEIDALLGDRDKMQADPRFSLRVPVVIPANKSRVIRVRPMIPVGWQLRFVIEFDETVIDRRALEKAMVDAGTLKGLNTWRPKFGRFLVEEVKEVKPGTEVNK